MAITPKQRHSAFRHPLDDVLGTASRVRVLRQLILHGDPQSPSDLASRTGLAKSTAADAVNKLLAHELVTQVGTGRYVTYEIRDSHFLASALGDLFQQEEVREERVYSALQKLAEEASPAPVAVWLYGSVARGTDRPDSDLDLVVIVESPGQRSRLGDVFREAALELEETWSLPPVSVVVVTKEEAEKGMRDAEEFYTNLRKDAVPVYGQLPTRAFSHG